MVTRFNFRGRIPTATILLLGNDLFFEAPFATCAHHHRLSDRKRSGIGTLVNLLAAANSTSTLRIRGIASRATGGLYNAACDDDHATTATTAKVGTAAYTGCFIASFGLYYAARDTDGTSLAATLTTTNAGATGSRERDGRFIAESLNITTRNIHFSIDAPVLATTYSGSKATAIGLDSAAIDVHSAAIAFISSTDAGTAATAKYFITVGVEFP